MRELPFSPDLEPFVKPVEVGDTNDIYYDPEHPDVLIRVPKDSEAEFLENDPKLIAVAEKIYQRLDAMGESLDIHVAPHQFILAKETSDGPTKPMLLAKRIDGTHLVPYDRENPKTLEATSRIAQLGLKYLDWIEQSRPRSVITDLLKPDQYLAQPGDGHDTLTLVDIETRFKERDFGKKMIELELGMLVGPLRDSEFDDTFCRYMQHALRTLKQGRTNGRLATMINSIINAPELYQQMSDGFLAAKEFTPTKEASDQLRSTPLVITKDILKRFGIEKL